MKSMIFTIFFTLAFTFVKAQYINSVIEYKSGTTEEGFVDKFRADDKTIKFTANGTSGAVKIKRDEISAITLPSSDGPVRIENITPSQGKDLFMRLIIKGPVNMYVVSTVGGPLGQADYYLVKRASEEKATTYNGLGFRKRMSAYFKDDPEIVKYIQETPLLSIDMNEIVLKYNANKTGS